ncbi:serine/threonine-protein kinase [Chondromyces crocatus]|uniref:Protein kinase domain-containing protein n=1 Tax=Chondromyces crocatus TaxID=52 RepID=A0A0K1ECN1_CHOCO|nr:serine/threonine-protein kinase [Chondromyces crocatus]AKT38457.1 uncharacterized protein CMC5_026040 [Chondromyces crocatus]
MNIASGTIVGGKYRIERPLSRGGMGSVWAGRHVALGSPVAIKFMAAEYAALPTFVGRFEREARIAANLRTPHVVHVGDYGIERGNPYIVMELLQGEDLAARLERVRRIPLHEALRILAQVAKALRKAHEAGLVHRDLKPGNIFLTTVEDEEVVKVLDFGIAKETRRRRGRKDGERRRRGEIAEWELTRTGELLGSPYYMSPEQVRGDKDIDHRSDLWSLGIILFRVLTGELPFAGDDFGSILSRILVDPVPRATSAAPHLPEAIDGFFQRCLERDRTKRFQSVSDMLEELYRVADLQPPITSLIERRLQLVEEQVTLIAGSVPGRRSGVDWHAQAPPPPSRTCADAIPTMKQTRRELSTQHETYADGSSDQHLHTTAPSTVTKRSMPPSEELAVLPYTSASTWIAPVAIVVAIAGTILAGWAMTKPTSGVGHHEPPQGSAPHHLELPAPLEDPPRAMPPPPHDPSEPAPTTNHPPPRSLPPKTPYDTPRPTGTPLHRRARADVTPAPSAPSSQARDPSLRTSSSKERIGIEPPGPSSEVDAEAASFTEGPPFPESMAQRQLDQAALQARSCATQTSEKGGGRLQVQFTPNGTVNEAIVMGPPFAHTEIGRCIEAKFRALTIPRFNGAPVRRYQLFSLP